MKRKFFEWNTKNRLSCFYRGVERGYCVTVRIDVPVRLVISVSRGKDVPFRGINSSKRGNKSFNLLVFLIFKTKYCSNVSNVTQN